MFYSQYVLAKKGPLGKIWLAAHMEKKVPKLSIIATNIPESVDNIQAPAVPMALRVSGHLLLGVVRIFSRKVTYLLTDCSEALVKIKDAFRAPSGVELAPGAGTKDFAEITRNDQFDDMDLDADLTNFGATFGAGNEDEVLVGITIPEDAMGDLAANSGVGAEEGFGANDNFEVFFEQPAEEDVPAEKRRRTSARLSGAAADVAMAEEEEETFRFGEAADTLIDTPHEDDGLLRDAAGARLSAGGAADAPMPSFDEPFDEPFPHGEEQEEPLGGMDGVMDGELRLSLNAPVDEAEAAAAKQKKQKPQKKRKMVLDDRLQLTTEQIRKQLNDTSSILRPRDEESEDAPKGRTGEEEEDLFGAPSLPFLPACVAQMPFFRPQPLGASNKRARDSAAGEEWHPLVEYDDEAMGERAAEEVGRPSDGAELGEMRGDALYDGYEHEPPEMPFELQPEDEPQPAGFDSTHVLPDMDRDSLDPSKDPAGRSQASQGRSPEAWSSRTRRMYAMLASAFGESEGEALSYAAMIGKTKDGPEKRRVVAGCFQELLYLCTHGLIDLKQQTPYANILVSKTELFEQVVAAH